jgi:hypothetical protein
MSDGIDETNSKLIDSYENFRFQDAALAIFSKYQTMGIIKSSDENVGVITTATTPSVYINRQQQQTTVSSRACTIL